jgi:hypothetical protein
VHIHAIFITDEPAKYLKESANMTIQTINLGSYANDGTGDDLRTAFQKVNANFALLDNEISVGNAVNLGSGTGLFASKNGTNLDFKSLTSTGNTVIFTTDDTTVNLETVTKLETDVSPKLGGDLNLNQHHLYGGDIQSTVYTFSIPLMHAFMAAAIESSQLNLDAGTFQQPVGYAVYPRGYDFEFGTIIAPTANAFNFGTIA